MKNRNFLSLIGLVGIIFFFTSCAQPRYVIVSPASGVSTQMAVTAHPVVQSSGRVVVSQQRPVVQQQRRIVVSQGAVMQQRPVVVANGYSSGSYGYNPYASGYSYGNRVVSGGYGYYPYNSGYGYSNGYYGSSSYYPSWEQLQMQAGARYGSYGYGGYGYGTRVVSSGYGSYGYGVQPRVGIGVNGNAISVSYQGRNFGISVAGGWNSNPTYRTTQVVQQRPVIYPTY